MVIALSVMAFILLLVLSLSTLVRVEIGASQNTISRLKAQQNALLGLYIAIGELQLTAGPDQRITAQADILPGSDLSKKHFTGVWSSAPGSLSSPMQWLASDWDESQLNYASQVSPSISDPTATTPTIKLVGTGSAGLTADSEDIIRVSLENTQIVEPRGEIGSYAWWVSDENTKSSIRPLMPPSTGGLTEDRYRKVLSLGSKDAADLAVLPAFTLDTVEPADLRKALDRSEMELVGYNTSGIEEHFHDFTVAAYGVPTNARDGGLKKDLSLAFELTDTDFNSSEFAAGGANPVPVLNTSIKAQPIFYDSNGGRGPSWHLLRDYYTIYQRMQNPLTDPVFPAQHFLPNHDELGFPTSLIGNGWRELAAMRFENPAVWDAGSSGDPLLSNSLPYLIRANYAPYMQRWIQSLGLLFRSVSTPPAGRDPNYNYVRPIPYVNPAAVFHNPYNVSVEHHGLMSVINHVRFNLMIQSLVDGVNYNSQTGGNVSMFKVEGGVMAPGESKVYFGLEEDESGFSEAGTPLAEDFFQVAGFSSTMFGTPIDDIRIAVDPNGGGANVEVDFAPFNSQLPNASQRWPVWQFHSIGSEAKPVLASFDRNSFATNLYNYAGYQEDTSILQPLHGDWLDNPGTFTPNSYNDPNRETTFANTNLHVDGSEDAPIPYVTVDDYLKPADARLAYPLLALSNPFAPIKGSTNLLNGEGYPVYAPSWQMSISKATLTTGQAVIESQNNGLNAYWGSSNTASGQLRASPLVLPVIPPTSIGQLQSANLATLGTMPALAVGNSFATPYLQRDQIVGTFANYKGSQRLYHDLSYHLNDVLWDNYYFSSYSVPYNINADNFDPVSTPPGLSFDAAFDPDFSNATLVTGSLPNPRMKLLLGDSEDLNTVKAKIFNDNGRVLPDGVERSAENLLVEGAFNVNSTSVEAWAAVLAAGRGNSVHRSLSSTPDTLSVSDTALSRSALPSQGAFDGDTASDEAWSGYRTLSDTQIRTLAQSIVDESKARVQNRGFPFTSLSEFVNRQLSNDDFGLAGLLQAAIDRSNLNSDFETASADFSSFPHPTNITKASGNRAVAMGAAAHINQADILQGIGSFVQVRSDTFRVRSYGDVRNPITGKVISQVWCEAVVQRIPSPVYPNGSDAATDPKYWDPDPNQPDFGRRFEVIYIRFLDEDSV